MALRHAGFALLFLLAMVVLVIAGGNALNLKNSGLKNSGMESSFESGIVFDTEMDDPFATMEPDDIVAPEPADNGMERLPPREPLSELSLAVPPQPKADAEWAGATLLRPLAAGAGRIEAQGRSVTIAGIEAVAADETCVDGSRQWPCGAHAASAFRAFLRARAVVCDIPDDGSAGHFTARCRLARQDIGEWLVENGWARAPQDSPYAAAAEKAKKARKGIYGRAPDLSGLPQPPRGGGQTPAAPDSIIAPSDLPVPSPPTPPDGLPEPLR